MANIRVDIDHTITNGSEIIFESPCDCTFVTGLNIYYPNSSGEKVHSSFVFKDAHGNDLSNTDLFAKGAYVKVILNSTHGIAYIQNADTNKYLENRFKQLEEKLTQDTHTKMNVTDDGDGNIILTLVEVINNV